MLDHYQKASSYATVIQYLRTAFANSDSATFAIDGNGKQVSHEVGLTRCHPQQIRQLCGVFCREDSRIDAIATQDIYLVWELAE